MAKISFEKADKKTLVEFAEELANCITENGFNALSKNDFYDFVLYLLDKYSDNHFLSANSNHKNAMLLKVKQEKLKSSKLNIFLKYTGEEKQQEALNGIVEKIIDNPKIMQPFNNDENSQKIQLTIEDPISRFCLDGKMKAELGVSPDTSFNSEIIVMRKEDFLKVLQSIMQDNKAIEKGFAPIEKLFNDSGMENGITEVFKLLIDGTFEVLDKATPLPVNAIRKALGLIYKKA